MRASPADGFSLGETLVSLGVIAVASAALLPAVVLAHRLQRDSAMVTAASLAATARLERLKGELAAGRAAEGGALDEGHEGWRAFLDREGAMVTAAGAVFECRWRVTAGVSPGVRIAAVRVAPLGGGLDVTLSTAVPDE